MSSDHRLAVIPPEHAHPLPAVRLPVGGLPLGRPRPAVAKPGFDFGIAVRAVRRYWLPIALLGGLLGAGAAAAIWKFLPPARESAYTVLHISSQPPHLFYITPEAQVDAAVYRQRQQQAVTSPKVLETALKNPKVAGLPVARKPGAMDDLARMVTVDFKLGQEFMRITVQADTAEESLILAGAIKDAYLSEVVNKERGLWEKSVARREEALKEAEHTFAADQATLAKKLEPFDLKPSDVPLLSYKLRNIQLKADDRSSELLLTQTKLDRLVNEQKRQAGSRNPRDAVTESAVAQELDRDPQYQAVRSRRLGAEQKLADNERSVPSGSNPPFIVKLREDVKSAREEEEKYKRTAIPQITAQLVEKAKSEQRDADLGRNREIELLRDREKALTAEVDQLARQMATLSTINNTVEAIVLKIAREEKQIDEERGMIQKQRREVENAPSRVSEHEEPRLIPVNELQRRLKYAGMAAIAGLGAVAAGFAGRELLRNRVSDPAQVTGLTLPVLGALPALEPTAPLVAVRSEASLTAAEAIDTVRTMLLHAVAPTGPRAVLVTSAVPGEGKTTLTSCLAASLARAGYRTLLVDGDLRRPTAHANFRTPIGPGVADILRGRGSVRTCCREVPGLGLWVLPAGQDSATAGELLPQGGWRRLIQEAREHFDYVIVDSSPLLAVVDPVLMAPVCDGVVLAVLRDVSRVNLLAEAADRLRTLDIPVVGCVVHRAYQPASGRYYYSASATPAGPAADPPAPR